MWAAFLLLGTGLILDGVQSARSGLKRDIRLCRITGDRFDAIPHACTAVNAFFALKFRNTLLPGSDGLSGADFDAELVVACFAQVRI